MSIHHKTLHTPPLGNRLVIKVGSSLVTNDGRGLDLNALMRWSQEINALIESGREVVLVSSGAIAEGLVRLGFPARPSNINALQAAAAVGQMGLIQAYESAFRQHNIKTAQILLTHEDLADRTRYLNARSTLQTLLTLKVVPIINENDTVATAEIRFGDNDTLGALVTNLVEADCFIILTDQTGLFEQDPRKYPNAPFVHCAQAGDPELERMAGGAGSSVGTGGMLTKILAAKRAARSGAHTIIASGREKNVLSRLAQGESIGTTLVAPTNRMTARKQWLADHLQLSGTLILDQGAANAVAHHHASLLPIGVVAVEGDFVRGECVLCQDEQGREVARGLVNYSASDARKIVKRPSNEIETILGYCLEVELIHRDNMVNIA